MMVLNLVSPGRVAAPHHAHGIHSTPNCRTAGEVGYAGHVGSEDRLDGSSKKDSLVASLAPDTEFSTGHVQQLGFRHSTWIFQ